MKTPGRFFLFFAIAAVSATAIAAGDEVTLSVDGSRVEFLSDKAAEAESFTLTITAPDGRVWREAYTGFHLPAIDLRAAFDDRLPDGRYHYEILPHSTPLSGTVAPELRGLEARTGAVPSAETGTFTVLSGQVLDPNRKEPVAESRGPLAASGSGKTDSSTPSDSDQDTRDFVINDDLIVQGSACVGFDCINNESFGFDTIRLKENNLRIVFIDTSTAAGFPSGDWQLRANDSASGGANFFSIDWLGTNASSGNSPVSTPFRVDGTAPTNAIRVDSAGRVGFRTSSPVLDLHVATGNTPGLRLEQNNSSGFSAQTWDIAGNEANFFIRDVTGGSRLPFRIRPGAPTSSIDIAASGNVGIGTTSPSAPLHVNRTGGVSDRQMLVLESEGGSRVDFLNTNTGNNWRFATENNSDSFVVTKLGSGQVEMRVDNAGNLTIPGTLFQGSDVRRKFDIVSVNASEILDRLMELPIAFWRYRNDATESRHIGPMAQDFSRLFGVGANETSISALDPSGVALAAIQAVNERVMRENTLIRAENEVLHQRIERLEQAVETLMVDR